MIEILSTGAVNSVQDMGRRGYLDVGVGWSGAMDRPALAVANSLVGNGEDAAGIEIALFPFRIRFKRRTAFAVVGADCPVTLDGRALPSWWAETAGEGQVLTVGLPRKGARAYLAVAGGIETPQVLGSRATDLKSGFGGLEGRGLRRGDRLPVGPARGTDMPDGGFGIDPTVLGRGSRADGAVRLRVLPAAEFDDFADEARQQFLGADWCVSAEANRMGYRLDGPVLALKRKLELFSHGIMPGTVQVPPSGQPIIQLAEANTCGGYPKIATVIEPDLWRLAQAPVGATLRFELIERSDAVAEIARERAALSDIAALARLARRDRSKREMIDVE